MNSNPDYVSSFRQISPYIKSYKGKTFVLMLPEAAVTHANFANITHDIALLNHLGVRIILVHGARQQTEQKLQDPSTTAQIHQGIRAIDSTTSPLLVEAIASTRFAIEASLSTGLPNSPMHNANIQVRSGNFITAMPIGVVDGVDLQYAGKVRKVDIHSLDEMLFNHAIVLISPLGFSATGEVFNLNYTELATKIAIDMNADKLIAFTKNNGAFNDNRKLQKQLTLLQCEKLLLQKDTSNIHLSLKACYKACDQGVNRAHIISYIEDGALIKELFTRDGFGTMVHRDSYETIRRARIDDISGILELIKPLELDGVLTRRPRELLEQEINHFTVMEIDGTVIACAALYPFVKGNTGELACMVTHPDYQRQGKAAKLLSHIEKQAGKLKISQLFVLTTQTAHWFLEQGFSESSLEILPQEKQKVYNYQRNSKIFVKTL
ncbi:amino-acid N-acetyltransferase [Candidatus Endobugula sertula]|uniref:Amino-acid acetyltransferase n=1 Tax=Candidatus Endobugula sertula TaxID=62101 RepID=A0A1D2QSH9_9GAMM|nr:amino-acid N-acetyltransferase [Candidatus Endobugula sertula]